MGAAMNALTVPKRAPKRSRVFLSAQIEAGGGPVEARIRDISASGALLESPLVPDCGSDVSVTCGKVRLDGRVVWAENGWFGVEFDQPLEMGRLVDAAGTQLQVSAPRTYRAGEELE